MISKTNVDLKKIVGGGYGAFWRCKKRYRVVKGSRGSKKSKTTALWYIANLMKYPLANLLIIRRVFNTHKDSTYAELKWAVRTLKVSHLWHFSKSPLEAIYKPTGQKILFRGLDDPMSITSITVETGHLCWAWFEESFQIKSEDDFNKVDMSIRGELPPGYFKQLTLTFNPWSDKHWLKKRFYDVENEDVFAITTTYKNNEFLGKDDVALFESMRINNLRRYKIEGLGDWGISEGLIYDFVELDFNYNEIAKREKAVSVNGLDFGFSADPTAFVAVIVDKEMKEIYVYDEIYKKGLVNQEIYNEISYKGFAKSLIIADSADPKSIEELRRSGLSKIKASVKGPDSVLYGIQLIQGYKLYVHPKCFNTIVELSNYSWDVKDSKVLDKPIDDYNHALDALRYAVTAVITKKQFKTYKDFL